MLKLSLRKYAATIGVSHTAVAKAVKSGYIIKGWDTEAKKIVVEIANAEWGNEIKERNGSNVANSNPHATNSFSNQDTTQIAGNITYQEARRLKEIYNAEISRIAALKENGIYVEKEKVYKELFAFGQQMRTAFQSIPDRVIDHILAAKTRHEAHQILYNAIYDVLMQLTNPPEIRS